LKTLRQKSKKVSVPSSRKTSKKRRNTLKINWRLQVHWSNKLRRP
jgi:hypothetical protein